MKLIHSTMRRFLMRVNVHLKAWDILGIKFLLVLKVGSSFTLSPAHTDFFQSKKHPVLSRTIVEHWKYGLFGIPCNTSDTKRNIISNIIFVLVNAWYLCVRWMHVINHLCSVCMCAVLTELVTCLYALCTTQEFNFLFFTGLSLSSLSCLHYREDGEETVLKSTGLYKVSARRTQCSEHNWVRQQHFTIRLYTLTLVNALGVTIETRSRN